jgi:hypothetical protein
MFGISLIIYSQFIENGFTMITLYHVTKMNSPIIPGGIADAAPPRAYIRKLMEV